MAVGIIVTSPVMVARVSPASPTIKGNLPPPLLIVTVCAIPPPETSTMPPFVTVVLLAVAPSQIHISPPLFTVVLTARAPFRSVRRAAGSVPKDVSSPDSAAFAT